MALRNPLAAANARVRTVVDYGPDPADRHARGLLYDAYLRVQGFLVPAVVGADSDPERTFTGYGPKLQDFRGAAAAATTTVVYKNPSGAEMSAGLVDKPNDPTRSILAARLRRNRSVL